MLTGLARRVVSARAALDRATAVPFLVRCGVGFCGLIAMVVAWPAEMVGTRYFVLPALVAIYPAVAPRSRGASFAALVVVAGWIVDTAAFGAQIALWRVLTLAGSLYLAHTLTALAAVLPYDAVVGLDLVGGWLLRAMAVVLVAAVLTVVTLGLSADLAGGAFLIATLVGLAGAVGATILIARLLRRT